MRLTSIVLKIAMHRVLNVAEKNDASKSLARLLSKNGASMVLQSHHSSSPRHLFDSFSVKVSPNLIKSMNSIINYSINQCR